MNRLFGRGKPKEPGPSISDCITGVSIEGRVRTLTKIEF